MWFMSRNKTSRRIALALAVLLCLSPAVSATEPQENEEQEYVPQDIIDLTQVEQEEAVYETAEVLRGSFVDEDDFPLTPYRPFVYNLKFERNDAKFLEYAVSKGDEVKKGDVLVRFTVNKSEVELTRLSLSLQRAKEQMEEGIRQREEAIEQKRAEVKTLTDDHEKKMAELSLEKLEVELKQYKLGQERSIAQQQEAYNKEKAQYATDVLTAPADGVVTELTPKLKDNPVYSGEVLVTMTAGATGLWVVAKGLRYNMPVQVKAKDRAGEEVLLSGRVVAANDTVPAAESGMAEDVYSVIQLDPYDEEKYTLSDKLRCYAELRRMDDVLLVPTKAIKREDDKSYVLKLKDGVTQKRYLDRDAVFSTSSDAWVFRGVEEGDTLILN